MSEPFFRLSNPSPKAGTQRGGYNHAKGGDHSAYITRESATHGDREAIVTHQLPEHATAGSDYREQRSNITSYWHQRVEDELDKSKGARTHYRMTASFGGRVETQTARQMAQEFLDKNFPDARAVAAVHQNTEHSHIHFYVDARTIDREGRDGKKLDLDQNRFKSLNRNWTELHERHISRDDAREHQARVAETARWKQEYRQAKSEGREPDRPAPERQKKHGGREPHEGTEQREYANQRAVARDERFTTSRASAIPDRGSSAGKRDLETVSKYSRAADREIDSSLATEQRAQQGVSALSRIADLTVRATERLHSDFEKLGDRAVDRDLELERDHDRSRDDDTGRDQ